MAAHPSLIPIGWFDPDFIDFIDTGTLVNLLQSSETDSALGALGKTKAKALNQSSETDSAQAIGKLKTKLTGQASETDAAQPIGKLKTRTLGQTSETDTAQRLGKYLLRASEVDSAQAITKSKSKAIGQASETDTAQRLGKPVGRTLETDTAQSVTELKTRAVGQATETDVAQPIAKLKTKAVSQATETDVAQTFTELKTKTIGQVLETDSAQVITPTQAAEEVDLNQASETDSAQAIGKAKSKAVGQASETDSVQRFGRARSLDLVSETDSAQTIAEVKGDVLGIASETDTVQAFGKTKVKAIGQASEANTAQGVTPVQGAENVALNQASETDTVQAIGKAKYKTIGQTAETDTALSVADLIPVGRSSETDSAQAITFIKGRAVGQAGFVSLTAARTFSGTGHITFDNGDVDWLPTSPTSVAAIAKRAADGVTHVIFAPHGGGTATFTFAIRSDNSVGISIGGTLTWAALDMLTTDGWCLIGASGTNWVTTAPRFHKYVFSTGIWSHAAGGSVNSPGTPNTPTDIQVGTTNGAAIWNGDQAVGAIWNSNLSDGDFETLDNGFANWLTLTPNWAILLNQASVSTDVLDATGNGGDQTARTGTTVTTSGLPAFFTNEATNTAQSFAKLKAKAVGQSSTTNTALTIAPRRSYPVGIASETDSSFSIGKAKRKALNQASETDTVQPFTEVKLRAVNPASETDLSQTISRIKNKTLGQVFEADSARPITQLVDFLVVLATSPLDDATNVSVNTSIEITFSDPVNIHTVQQFLPEILDISLTLEDDTAQSLAKSKKRALVQVSMTNIAQVINELKRKGLVQPFSANTSQPVTKRKKKSIGFPTSSNTAQFMSVDQSGGGLAARGSGGSISDPEHEYGTNITYTNKTMARHWFGGGSNLTLTRCKVGNITTGSYPIFQVREDDPDTRISNVTLNQTDYYNVNLPDHTEGLWFSGVDGFTWSDCRFWNNDVFCVALYAFPMADEFGNTDGLIQRCWFGDGPRGGGRVWVGNLHDTTFINCHFKVAPVITQTFGGVTVTSGIVFEDCVFGDQMPIANGATFINCEVGTVSATPPNEEPDGTLDLEIP